ncbi:MAG: thiamine diphosphokinase [Candidatus Xenobia bacterium]
MPDVVVIAGGDPVPPHFLQDSSRDLMVIAADRGARYALEAGVRPDLVVGDCDSLDQATIDTLREQGIKMEVHPREKDASDLELALHHAFEQRPSSIRIVCALGGRIDHLLTNVMLLRQVHARKIRCTLHSPDNHVCLVDGDAEVLGAPGDIVTLLALTPVHGITTAGLRYPLRDADLLPGSSRGLSNELLSNCARVSCRDGELLLVYHRCSALS